MLKRFLQLVFLASAAFLFAYYPSSFVFAQNQESAVVVNFFYSKTCPHCAAEKVFLEKIALKYPAVEIKQHLYSEPQSQALLRDLLGKSESKRYMGLVPLTFVNERFFLGFDNEQGIGKDIEQAIKEEMGGVRNDEENKINIPLLGKISGSKGSLFFASIALGFVDGFNVCSLGALVLILGLVLALKSRTKTIIFGSIFILTTGLVYGSLIFLWYKIFTYFTPFLRAMELLLAVLGIGGGVYFLRDFLKIRKRGPVCEKKTKGLSFKISAWLNAYLAKPNHILLMAGAVLLFAFLVAVIEFPCSALVPVTFAGLLAKSQVSAFYYFLLIALYVLFYMLDELAVFLVAVFTMKLWVSSAKFTKTAVLIEAMVLFALGLYYLASVLL